MKQWFIKIGAKILGRKLGLTEGPMTDTKKWYQSKGVLTGIVTVLITAYEGTRGMIAPQFGWDLPEIPVFVYTVLGALGIYARKVASKKIG